MMMDNLEQYIKNNSDRFYDQEIPEGHLDRFEARLASNAERRLRLIRWTAGVSAIAAALAAIIFLARHEERHADWFVNVGNDQAEICKTYYQKAGELSYEILSKNPDGSLDQSLSSLSEETVPLIDQLPDEMDPEVKIAVLKEYYGDLLQGLEKIRNIN